MDIKPNYKLCGGTFFFLLLKANDNSNVSQDLRFKYFLNVIDPDAVRGLADGETDKLHTYASNFRNGKKMPSDGKYVRLGKPEVCSIFRDELKVDSAAGIDRVKKFVDNYVSERSRIWLVRALLELIDADGSIPNNKMFFAKPGFLPTYKEELLNADAKISFYDFLLGIWYYVYENCEDNSIGERTIKNLSKPKKANVESEFDSSVIGVSDKFQNIEVVFECDNKNEEAKEANLKELVYLTEEDEEAPDLSFINPDDIVFVSQKDFKSRHSGKFGKYRDAAYKKHSRKRTFIYDTERPFRSFYVCSDIKRRGGAGQQIYKDIQMTGEKNKGFQYTTVNDFKELKNIVVGRGGLGKTMFMNHIFLTTLEEYDTEGCLPVFTTLSDYNPKESDLLFLISQAVVRYDSKLQLSDVVERLDEGHNVILLDGLDEVNKEYLHSLIKELEYLGDLYPDNMIIISSRNIPEIRQINYFATYDLMPLSETQAFEMINRLDPMYIDDDVKVRFIRDVKNRRFRFNKKEKEEFFGNPLFLTIMLISYSQTNNIPTQRYLFYEQAYRALATKHDGLKGITRNFFTGLNEREFQRIFGQFCADTYADHKLKFERPLLDKYLQKVIDDNNLNTTIEMFFKDITEKLCLVYLDGTEYRFIHRSFQEYFAAYYFTTLMDDEYRDIYEMLEELDEEIVSDDTISMLYGLDNKKCEKYIVVPFLESLFEYRADKSSEDYDEEYKHFVMNYYPKVEYATGELDDDFADNNVKSALYNFLVENYNIKEKIRASDFDNDEAWADQTEKYYFVDDYRSPIEEHYLETNIGNYTDGLGEPCEGVDITEAGYWCTITTAQIAFLDEFTEDNRWEVLFNHSSFPLRIEFDAMIELYKSLKEKLSDVPKKKKRFGLGR